MNQHHSILLAAAMVLAVVTLGACSKAPEQPVASQPPMADATTNVSDIDVTEHVVTALNLAPTLKGAEIQVVTTKGDVRLTGALDNQTQVNEAIRIARSADGAHAIHDELTIKP